MDPTTLTILGRIVERLIVGGGGLLSLWCGYKLFATVVANSSNAELSGHGFKFKAERIGPGIFFAMFGAGLLLAAVLSPVSLSVTSSGVGPSSGTVFRGVAPGGAEGLPAPVRAANALAQVFNSQGEGATSLTGAGYIQAKRATEMLVALRRDYVDRRYGAGTYDTILLMDRECQQNTPACRAFRADRSNVAKMDAVLDILSTGLD